MTKLNKIHSWSVDWQKYSKDEKRRELHYLGIYWTRKRNRKERLDREGWVLDSSPVHFYLDFFWYRKDGNRLGYVATSPQLDGWIGVQYRYKVGKEGMVQSLFNTRAEAQRWVEGIVKEEG